MDYEAAQQGVLFRLITWSLIILAGWVILLLVGFVAYGLWLVTSLLIGLF